MPGGFFYIAVVVVEQDFVSTDPNIILLHATQNHTTLGRKWWDREQH
jgi:hypothetical protein